MHKYNICLGKFLFFTIAILSLMKVEYLDAYRPYS